MPRGVGDDDDEEEDFKNDFKDNEDEDEDDDDDEDDFEDNDLEDSYEGLLAQEGGANEEGSSRYPFCNR